MYKVRLGGVDLDQAGESPNGTVARLQKVLGAVFSAAWHGYTALHPVPGKGHSKGDPGRNPVGTRSELGRNSTIKYLTNYVNSIIN